MGGGERERMGRGRKGKEKGGKERRAKMNEFPSKSLCCKRVLFLIKYEGYYLSRSFLSISLPSSYVIQTEENQSTHSSFFFLYLI